MKGWRSEAFYAMKILLCFEEGVEQLIDHIKPCVTVCGSSSVFVAGCWSLVRILTDIRSDIAKRQLLRPNQGKALTFR